MTTAADIIFTTTNGAQYRATIIEDGAAVLTRLSEQPVRGIARVIRDEYVAFERAPKVGLPFTFYVAEGPVTTGVVVEVRE